MKRNATAADRLKYAAPIAISFILTFLLMLFVYRVCHYAPWGNRSLATDDGYWQYMDFFGYYKDFFSGKSNLEYSFSNGLGMPGLGLFMYYLSSPFNLLIVFFKKENFHEFFDIMVALKLAAAASTACFYLKKRFKDKINILISIALSVSYAFMQYSFSKAACSMWLDGVFMLPLMLWGVYKLVNEKKPGFLSVTVGLTIFFNWYAAGMACMFSILWFFAEMILFSSQNRLESVKKEIGRFFGGVVRYGVSMLIGVGLSAVLFLPMVYQILQATRGSATWEFLKNSFHGNIFNVIPQYSMGMTSARGALCIFCGGLALLGVIGFFASKKIKTVYKWVLGAVLLIGILSCYWQPLFFITSLFQDEGSYYYRYSYMCCFTMLFMAGAFFSEEETFIVRISAGVAA